MKIERKFTIAAILIVLVMMFVAAIPLQTSHSTLQTMDLLRDSLDRQNKLEDLLDYLRDAETGQRGFVITGKESFLLPYHSAVAGIAALRKELAEQKNSNELQSFNEIFRLVDLKMAELAETIALRRDQGFVAAQVVVNDERGKSYMDELRVLIGGEVQYLDSRRKVLRLEMDRKETLATFLGMAVTAVNLLLLIVLMVIMFRVLKARGETAQLLQKATVELGISMSETATRNTQMEISAEMLQALGAISSLRETAQIISIYCKKLLPQLSGELFLYRNSRDLLEAQATWGELHSKSDFIDPKDCWALQRGGRHFSAGARDLCCAHYHDQENIGRVCVPLVTQGEVIGLLYMEGLPADSAARSDNFHLIDRVAEQIALALANVRLRESLRLQSIVDPLTGLFNRRYLDETFRRELNRAQRKNMPLALILADLDHFKRINDTFGHDAGDAVLKNVALQLQRNIRESDLACRFGGEELVVILTECEAEAALARVEVLRQAIAGLDVRQGGGPIGPVTASFGMAVFPIHGQDMETLLQAADRALYKAKQNGRNRVELAERVS